MLQDTFRTDKERVPQTKTCSGLVTFCKQPDQGLGVAWLKLDKSSS
jgi:hypothetical protein